MKKSTKDILNKNLVIESKVDSIDEKKKTATFVLSTSDVDRHGDIIEQSSWQLDNFKSNPVFLEQHKSDEFALGQFEELWFENDDNNEGNTKLMGRVKFATEIYDRAKIAFELVKEGFMRTVSVGFIPHDIDYIEDKDAFVLRDCELLEVSLVSVPANSMAVVRAKSAGIDTDTYFSDLKTEAKAKAIDDDEKPEVKEEEKPEEVKTAKQSAIEAKVTLDKEIKNSPETPALDHKKKARELLNKAIRKMRV